MELNWPNKKEILMDAYHWKYEQQRMKFSLIGYIHPHITSLSMCWSSFIRSCSSIRVHYIPLCNIIHHPSIHPMGHKHLGICMSTMIIIIHQTPIRLWGQVIPLCHILSTKFILHIWVISINTSSSHSFPRHTCTNAIATHSSITTCSI